LALIALLVALGIGYAINAATQDHGSNRPSSTSSAPASAGSSAPKSGSTASSVALSALPAQARATVTLIQRGGPFPYSQDGTVFSNAERLLPSQPRGYYHEYTVSTPGASTRGTRRIISGAGGQLYYTDDHYLSFRLIDPRR
jgi:ribonuclease T1